MSLSKQIHSPHQSAGSTIVSRPTAIGVLLLIIVTRGSERDVMKVDLTDIPGVNLFRNLLMVSWQFFTLTAEAATA